MLISADAAYATHSKPLRASYGRQQIAFRPVRGSDKTFFRQGFSKLSPASRRLRYGFLKKDLSDDELRLATEVDHVGHVAWIAVLLDEQSGHEDCGIAEARFVRLRRDPTLAEVALTVADDWQRRGIGGRLLDILEEQARARSIKRLQFDFDDDNLAMRDLLRRRYPHAQFSARGALISAVCFLHSENQTKPD